MKALESESRLKVIYEKAGFGLERDRACIAVAIHVRTDGKVVANSANVLSPDGFSL